MLLGTAPPPSEWFHEFCRYVLNASLPKVNRDKAVLCFYICYIRCNANNGPLMKQNSVWKSINILKTLVNKLYL